MMKADHGKRRMGDVIRIPGDYQHRVLNTGPAPQRFWHDAKYREALRWLSPQAGDRILDLGCGSGVAASMLAITPHIYRKLAYDPLRDFVPVGYFVLSQTAICVNGSSPAKTVRDFVELAKARPGQLMGSAGVGSTSHLGGILFATQAGITVNHVPYKGAANMAAVAQGEVTFVVAPLSAAMPQVRAGRVRCLATGGDKRSVVMPDLATIAESGVPGFRFYGWNGVIAPRGTPRPIILKFNRVMNDALNSAVLRKQYFELGEEPAIGSPEDFGKLIRDDYERMGKLVKLAGIRAE